MEASPARCLPRTRAPEPWRSLAFPGRNVNKALRALDSRTSFTSDPLAARGWRA